MKIDFRNYNYYPFLHTRNSEEEAFLNLHGQYKELIIPSFILHNRKGSALTASLNKITEKYDGNFILFPPISEKVINQITDEERKIFDNNNAYQNWREFLSQYPKAIPGILTPNANSEFLKRDVIRQAIMLERDDKKIAFRVKNNSDLNFCIDAVSALDSPENAIIFVDCGHIDDLNNSFNLSSGLIEKLKNQLPKLNITLISNSFPSSPAVEMTQIKEYSTHLIKGGYIQQKEVELYLKISEIHDISYGDYASIYPIPIESQESEGRWSARIDFCTLDDDWSVFRLPRSHGEGYQPLAEHILNLELIDNIPQCWGRDMLEMAAKGNLLGRSPSKWVSVRANTHMSRQISLVMNDDVSLGEF
ncbi:TPA: hypothetical protein QB322_001999 [Pasteurella multocida]|nr:hypothetical protein [Pasteurella multocida]HDR1216606.1 hypothetical protein [Pasteurella multocida]